jgi:thioesterase domain-containing protein
LWMVRFARNSWHWFSYFCRGWTPKQRRTFIERKMRACKKRLRAFFKMAPSSKKDAEDEVDLSLYTEDQRRLWDLHLRASANYHPRPYPGNVAVFRTRTHPFFCSFDPTFGWGELAEGGVTVRVVPGAHESILDEPYVQVTAEKLRACLAEAHARAEQTPVPESASQKVARMALSCFLYLMDFAPAL